VLIVSFWLAVRRLALGLSLIAAASAVLLLSDLGRRTADASNVRRIAIVQHLSTAVHDDAVRGMLDALAARGYENGKNATIQRFNAQGDMATGQAIAKQVVGGDFDVVVTSSTPSMQAVANATRPAARSRLGIVADPFVSGIGRN
jgi:putative ABC transport system substrate-binding protein